MADDNEKKDEQKTNDTAEEAGEGDPCVTLTFSKPRRSSWKPLFTESHIAVGRPLLEQSL